MFDVTHPDDRQRARQAVEQVAEGHLIGFEARVICGDCSIKWLWNARAMPERGVVYGVARDTTGRHRAEVALREARDLRALAGEQAGLRRVATLVRQTPQAEVFGVIVEEVGRLLGVDSTGMVRFEEDGPASSSRARAGVVDLVPVSVRLPVEGHSITSMVHGTGAAACLDDDGECDRAVGRAPWAGRGPLGRRHADHGRRLPGRCCRRLAGDRRRAGRPYGRLDEPRAAQRPNSVCARLAPSGLIVMNGGAVIPTDERSRREFCLAEWRECSPCHAARAQPTQAA